MRDDGAGFDREETNGTLGLANMNYRTRQLGGRLSVDSVPGQGTRVTASGPLVSGVT